jgi:uncharacterized YigZ family protein
MTQLETVYVPYQEAESEFVEKRSRFIGHIWPVDSEDQAQELIRRVKKQHYDARHNCWCYLLGGSVVRYSDDGEPQGTAGQPMLAVFQREHVTNVLCVVTRYFGGILLGSGGLIRAYSTGASIAVKAASKAKIVPCGEYQVTLDYPQLGSFQNLLSTVEGEQTDAQYTDRIALTVVVPQEQANVFESRVVETFNATVVPQLVGTSNRPVKV